MSIASRVISSGCVGAAALFDNVEITTRPARELRGLQMAEARALAAGGFGDIIDRLGTWAAAALAALGEGSRMERMTLSGRKRCFCRALMVRMRSARAASAAQSARSPGQSGCWRRASRPIRMRTNSSNRPARLAGRDGPRGQLEGAVHPDLGQLVEHDHRPRQAQEERPAATALTGRMSAARTSMRT